MTQSPIHYLEDWLLCMHGALNPDGTTPKFGASYWNPPFPVATYDKRFLVSVTLLFSRGLGLTDRQIPLAITIITKYLKKWQKLGLDPSYLLNEDIPLRMPMRQVDRTNSVTLVDNMIEIKFPHNTQMIRDMYRYRDAGCSKFEYNAETKKWLVELIECNVHLLGSDKRLSQPPFEVDPRLLELFEKSQDTSCLPRMVYSDKMVLQNVPIEAKQFLLDNGWIEDSKDILKWALFATRLGIAIDESVVSQLSPIAAQVMGPQVTTKNYTGTSSVTWEEFKLLTLELPNQNFVFNYRKKSLEKVRAIMGDDPRFVYTEAQHSRNNTNITELIIDLKNTILVTDIVIGVDDSASGKCLGTVYMIPDDARRHDANLQDSDQG